MNDAILKVVLCFIIWPVFQILAAVICQKLPDKVFDYKNKWFRTKKFENDGMTYQKFFKVKKWKKFLPDGAAIIKSGYRKKHIKNFSPPNMELFLKESCRAELGHLLAIPPFIFFAIFLPPILVFVMFIYAILVNMPCIIAQRYNRPRIVKLVEGR